MPLNAQDVVWDEKPKLDNIAWDAPPSDNIVWDEVKPISSFQAQSAIASTTGQSPYPLKPTEDPLLNRIVSGTITPITHGVDVAAHGLQRILQTAGIDNAAPRANDINPPSPPVPFSPIQPDKAGEIALGGMDVASGIVGATMGAIPAVAEVNAVVSAISPAAQELGNSIGGEKGKEIADKILQYGAALKFGVPVAAGMAFSDVTGILAKEGLNYTKLSQEAKDKILDLTKTITFAAGTIGAHVGMEKFAERGINAIPDARQPNAAGGLTADQVAEANRMNAGTPNSLATPILNNGEPSPAASPSIPILPALDTRPKTMQEAQAAVPAADIKQLPYEGSQEQPIVQAPAGVTGMDARPKPPTPQSKEELNRAIDEQIKTGQPVGTSAKAGASVVDTPTDRLLRAMGYNDEQINSYLPQEKNDIVSMSVSKSPADFARDAVKIGEKRDKSGNLLFDLYNIENPAYGEKINNATIAVKPNENLADRVMAKIAEFQGYNGVPILSLGAGQMIKAILPPPSPDEQDGEPLWRKVLRGAGMGLDIAGAIGLATAAGISVAKRGLVSREFLKAGEAAQEKLLEGVKNKTIAINDISIVAKGVFSEELKKTGLFDKLNEADKQKVLDTFKKNVIDKIVQNDVILNHYSKVATDQGITLSQTKPSYMGKGMAGEEQSRSTGRPKVTYFYPEGSKEEWRITPYDKYKGVGQNIYPANSDILDFQTRANGNLNKFERLVKAAGYDGVRFDREDGYSNVFMFKPVDVTSANAKAPELTAAYKLDDNSIVKLGNVHTIPEGLDVSRIVDAGFALGDKFLSKDEAAKLQNKPKSPLSAGLLSFGLGTAAQVAINNSDLDEETKKRYRNIALGLTLAGMAGVVMSSEAQQFVASVKSSVLAKVMRGEIRPAEMENEVVKQIKGAKDAGELNNFSAEDQKQITDLAKMKADGAELDLIAPIKPQPASEAKAIYKQPSGVLAADIVPAVKEAVKEISSVADGIKKIFAPTTRGRAAETTAQVMRVGLAEKARNEDLAYSALEKAHTAFAKAPREDNLAFIDAYENGKKAGTPQEQQASDIMHEQWQSRWEEMNKRGMIENYVTDYFSHLFKDPAKAADALADMPKSLKGSQFFLKERNAPTIKAAIDWAVAKGITLEPISYNPVDIFMSSIRSMDKAIMANDVISTMKANGMMAFVKMGEQPPANWVKISPEIGLTREKGTGLGNYYMPEPAATIINNHLSAGISNRIGLKQIRQFGNLMNQVQLSLSGFHAGFTTNEAIISNVALSIKQLTQGNILKAGETLIKTPIRPFTNVVEGNKFFKDYLKNNPEDDPMLRAWLDGGNRRGLDKMYYNSSVQKFWDALHSAQSFATEGEYGRAALRGTSAAIRAPFAAVEVAAKPLMQWLVPRQKAGAFLNGARDIVADFDAGKITPQQRMAKLQLLQDSIDNRFGQLVYDNLFWNKTLKDVLMLSTRSVGWNFGTVRELGGGLTDFARYPKNALQGKGMEFTDRMAYTIALPAVVALEGAMAMYIMTGQSPSEIKDYFFPKTGKKNKDGTDERLSLPSYMKDVAAYTVQPTTTVAHKLHPMWGAMYQMLNNEDYYGANITDADKASPQWMKDYAVYAAKQFVPFSVTGFEQRRQAGESVAASAQAGVGITPAPRYIDRTPAEEMMQSMMRGGASTSTKAESEQKRFKNDFLDKVDEGTATEEDFKKAQELKLVDRAGSPSESLKNSMVKNHQERMFATLKPDQAVDVWKAMKPEEKPTYARIFRKKLGSVKPSETTLSHDELMGLIQESGDIASQNPPDHSLRQKFEELRSKVSGDQQFIYTNTGKD